MVEDKIVFEVIPSDQNEKWNDIVHSFQHWDIYYLNEYAHSLEIHGDGEAFLIYFEQSDDAENCCRLCYIVMRKDISENENFVKILSKGIWYDLETPYGYGGFLMEGTFTEWIRKNFESRIMEYARVNKIVSQFVRFYPVYRNDIPYAQLSNSKVVYLKDTIYIDTTKEDIMLQMDSKNRNMVRKAKKRGVTICHDKGENLDDFIRIYENTMKQDHAAAYYYFERKYYEYLIEHMQDNIEFFYSVYDGKRIGAAIFFYNQEYMHYHLSGLYPEYRTLAATNLLLYEAARWACEKGIRLLHLGGGMEADDSLFGFKKQFNKDGRLPFYVGRTIYNQNAYEKLLLMRKQADELFDLENNFMIQYRR